jgi:hypothetical protein
VLLDPCSFNVKDGESIPTIEPGCELMREVAARRGHVTGLPAVVFGNVAASPDYSLGPRCAPHFLERRGGPCMVPHPPDGSPPSRGERQGARIGIGSKPIAKTS